MNSRRRKRWQKYLSMALAVTLTFSSASTGWAQEAVPVATESTEAAPVEPVKETKAQATETAAPETKAAETTAPETKAAETETTAPETKAAETAAPETKAAETAAPETQAAETEAPETKAAETTAPVTQASETAAPETQVSETLPSGTEAAATEAQTASGTEETTSESQAAGTEATESAATEAEAAKDTESETTAASETATEAESATESETAATETASGSESETAATETESETAAASETASETEETEKAELSSTVLQEVMVRDGENGEGTETIIKYSVKIRNQSLKASSENTVIKAVLPAALIRIDNNTQTAGLLQQTNEDGTTSVCWEQQSISEDSVREYVFYALVSQGVNDTQTLKSEFYIDDEQISEGGISWINSELLLQSETKSDAETETETEKDSESENVKEEKSPTRLVASSGAVNIMLTAKPGVLKQGTELSVKRANTTAAANAIEQTLDESQNVEKVIAFDISLLLNGEKVQPDGEVTVSFLNLPFTAKKNDQELVVAHVPGNARSVNEVEIVSQEKNSVVIETPHFSVYAIAVIAKDGKIKKDDGSPKTIDQAYQPQNSLVYIPEPGSQLLEVFTSPAFDFHIFANEATLGAHTNGNVAVNILNGDSKNFGTNQNKVGEDNVMEYNYIGQSANGVGQIASGVTVVGANVACSLEGDNTKEGYIGTNGTKQSTVDIYQESGSEPYINIQSELEKLKQFSVALAGQSSDGAEITIPREHNDPIEIKVTGTNEINYLTVNASDLVDEQKNKRIVKLVGSEHKTLIINVDMTGVDADRLSNLVTEIDGYPNDENVVKSDCNILWNFFTRGTDGTIQPYTAADGEYAEIGTGDYFMGTILAPAANVKYGALNGSVIAQKTMQMNKESHNWKFTGLSAKLTVNKTLNSNVPGQQTFYFGVFTDSNGTNRVDSQRIRKVTISNGETKSIIFSNLKAGTTYYVFETNEQGVVLNNQTSGYHIVGNGTPVTIGGDNSANAVTIVNSLTALGSLKITKKVTVNGQQTTGTQADGKYHFIISKGGTEIQEVALTIENGAAKIVYVNGLEPGEYTVSEDTTKNPSGMTLVGTNGKTVTVTAGETAEAPTVEFTNNIECQSVNAVVSARKTLTGRDLKAEEFSFTLSKVSAVKPDGTTALADANADQTVKNAQDGTVSFAPLTYAEAGTYTYTLKESSTDGSGVTVDKTEYTVTVKVTDDGAGKLKAETSYAKPSGAVEPSQVIFANTYQAESTTAVVSATKTLTGRDLKAEEFSFTLSKVSAVKPDGTTALADANADQTVKNAQDGTVSFAPLTYKEAGTYRYMVKEVANSSDTATAFDSREYLVEVVVTDNGLGALSAKVNYPNGLEKIEFVNKNRSVSISKTDITGVQKLAGAHLQILDSPGAVVKEWDSTAEAQQITGLKPGIYTLRETSAPAGYTIAADTTFELKEDGTVSPMTTAAAADGTLLVKDKKTSVSVRKTDIAEGTPLTGAHLQILDANKTVVADWVSTKEDFAVEGLQTGVPYTLHEVKAPAGYELAADTVFQLNADGTVNKKKTTAAQSGGVLLVEDALVRSEKTSVTVVKTVSYNGLPLVAGDETFYAALYYDKDCTKLAAPSKEIKLQNAASAEVAFDNLEVGRTYYVGECDADGKVITSGEVAGGTAFQAKFKGENGNRAETAEGSDTRVELDNEMADVPLGYYFEGQLHVTKKLLGADGEPMDSDEVFYAGIFEDPEHTKLADFVGYNVLELNLAGGSEAENSTSVTLPDKESVVTVYVTEVDAQGNPVAGAPDFKYEVTVDGEKASLSLENNEAYVVITNQVEEEEEEEETETETETEKETEKKAQDVPLTGDETPVLPIASALAASALVILLLLQNERRRRAERKNK